MNKYFTVYRGDTLKFKRLCVPLRYQVAMLRTACLRKVRIEILRASQAKGDTAQGAVKRCKRPDIHSLLVLVLQSTRGQQPLVPTNAPRKFHGAKKADAG